MRISVVVSTYNREPSLRQTLAGLRRQTHNDFEVIVVNGPSTDATADVLAATDDVRALSCPAANLSRSRNIGIAAASGEVVAFIDDDAIPEATWLSGLDAAYDDPEVAGAGGLVFDHTGVEIQYGRYSACDRVGQARFDIHRPLDRFVVPGADPFLYLQGTNMCFRRAALVDIGGFDDDIEYMYDEAEVCLRLIDSGGRLVIVDGAAVHHRYLPSHIRSATRINLRPFLPMRNRAYFALQYGRPARTTMDVVSGILEHGEEVKRNARASVGRGDLTEADAAGILAQVDAGIEAGIARGLDGTRMTTSLPPPEPAAFLRFGTLRPPEERLSVCLLTRDYPPHDGGDLAAGLAARGHEVHVMTGSSGGARVDVEGGVWVHRLAPHDLALPDVAGHQISARLAAVADGYREVAMLHVRVPIDLVVEGCTVAAPDGLERRLAGLIAAATGLRSYAASRTAALLLEIPDEAAHLLLRLRSLWVKPPDEFVAGVHRLLAGEAPTAEGLAEGVRRLGDGMSREAFVRDVAASEEASVHLGDLRWLDRLERMIDEARVARVQALWPAPPQTFVAGIFDIAVGRPATRWEWLAAVGGLAQGRSRLQTLGDIAGGGTTPAWLRVIEARATTAASTEAAGLLRSALRAPDEAFVDALYSVVLRREPEPDGRRSLLARLAGGVPRGTLVHDVALSDEVVDRRLDTGFLAGVEGPGPAPSQRWKRPAGLVGGRVESALGAVRGGRADHGSAQRTGRA